MVLGFVLGSLDLDPGLNLDLNLDLNLVIVLARNLRYDQGLSLEHAHQHAQSNVLIFTWVKMGKYTKKILVENGNSVISQAGKMLKYHLVQSRVLDLVEVVSDLAFALARNQQFVLVQEDLVLDLEQNQRFALEQSLLSVLPRNQQFVQQ